MNKVTLSLLWFIAIANMAIAQGKTKGKKESKAERRARINALAKQEEEGASIYNKYVVFGLHANNDGYGIFVEKGFLKTSRVSQIFHIGFSTRNHPKEERNSLISGNGVFSFQNTPFVFGKLNNFYQLGLLYGQQRVIGNKSNKNGIRVSGIYKGGLSLGLVRPYYLQVDFSPTAGAYTDLRAIKYEKNTATAQNYFLDPNRVFAGTGFRNGWKDLKINPGLKLHTGLRFEFDRQIDRITAIELMLNAELYSSKVSQMISSDPKRFFFSSGIAFVLGRNKL
jgi:hypothetical protein